MSNLTAGTLTATVISPDVSRSEVAMAAGEALVSFEEYLIHLDGGNTVRSGLRTVTSAPPKLTSSICR